MSIHHVRRSCTPPPNRTWFLYRSWLQVSRCGVQSPKVQPVTHGRHMSIFQDFSKRLKGEIQSNAELQKSIQEFKKKAVELKNRTKETAEQLYKRVDAAREEAEARAKQVSAVVKEKVSEATDKVSEATMQMKESVGSLKFGKTGEKGKEALGKDYQEDTSASGPSDMRAEEAAGSTSYSTEQAKGASGGGSDTRTNTQESFTNRFLKGFASLSSSGAAAFLKLKNTKLIDVAKDSYNFIIEELTTPSSRRRARAKSTPTTTERSGSTAVVPIARKKSGWEKRWENLSEKARAHPMYRRLKGVQEHPVVTKGQEIAEDIRERWETSDSPVVHKIQDLNDSLFGETATATALKEIRNRDPGFSFPDFTMEVQESIRPVLQAYLKGDLSRLKKMCSREVVDRCMAEKKAYESQGIFFDNKILHISDVEVKETKLLGNVPIIIVAFKTQQIYCVRDRHGNITQGAKDDIQTVYYAWAMQQVSSEDMEDGDFHPRWQLREMQQLGIKAII